MTSNGPALVTDGITMQFGGLIAVSQISLRLASGDVTAIIGPNGAGKTTMFNMISGLLTPTAGRVSFLGTDITGWAPHRIATLGLARTFQNVQLFPNLNAVEFLEYLAAAKSLNRKTARQRIQELLEVVNLVEARKRPLGGFSGGMRQRVGIAQALLNDPELLIVDEPTAGLDPEERLRFRNLLSELSGARIVILSTHIVSDVEACAASIALIARGHLITSAAPEELLRSVEGKVWETVVPSADLPALRQQYLTSSTMHRSDGVHLRIVAEEAPGSGAVPQPPTLEDAYLYWVSGKKGEIK